MGEHIFDGIIRAPVNSTAARVTSQRNVQLDDDLTPHQVQERIIYLVGQRKKIGAEIGIVARAQHDNIMYRANRYPNFVKNHPHAVKLKEWVRIGKEMDRLNKYLAEEKAKRRAVAQEEQRIKEALKGNVCTTRHDG
jgi:hypothetical protein